MAGILSALEGICPPALLVIIIVLEVLFAATEPPLFPPDNPLKNYSLELRGKINILLHKAFETPRRSETIGRFDGS